MMEVVRLPTIDAWADHIAERFVALMAARPAARVCLATGNTPRPVYDRLVEAVRAGRLSFRDADVFLLDEFGGVPADADGRCDIMLRRALLDHVDLPESRYHSIDTDRPDLDAVCAEYDAAIMRAAFGSDRPGRDLEKGGLALTILGIGANGHIAMNEPGSPPDSPTRRVDLTPETTHAATVGYFGGRYAPTWGVTIGIAPILASHEVWLLATGAAKAPIVHRLLTEPVSPALPASFLREHPHTVLFVDEAASGS